MISTKSHLTDASEADDTTMTVVEECGKPVFPAIPPRETDPCTKALGLPKVRPEKSKRIGSQFWRHALLGLVHAMSCAEEIDLDRILKGR